MALLNHSVQVYGKLDQLFQKLLEGRAPDKFTRQFLVDLGFKSSNWHAAIGLLKGLGFLSPDGIPTQRYMDLLDKTKWKKVLAEAVKDAYSDIFVMKRKPLKSDMPLIVGKYKSAHNMSNSMAERAARTFWALFQICDQDALTDKTPSQNDQTLQSREERSVSQVKKEDKTVGIDRENSLRPLGLNYNIQIHLPATKDIEVYNAIFKSLREHVID